MACEIIKIVDSVVHVRIHNVMRIADMRTLEKVATELIEKGKEVRLLASLENFQGWEKTEQWDDIDFFMNHGDDIVKMAIVGDEQWKENAFLFVGKGMRNTEIEFFPPAALKNAEVWVTS